VSAQAHLEDDMQIANRGFNPTALDRMCDLLSGRPPGVRLPDDRARPATSPSACGGNGREFGHV